MKKKIIIIIAVLAVVAGGVAGVIYIKKAKDKEQAEMDKHLTRLSFEDFKEKIDNKDDFVLIITQTGCAHCEAYLPVFKKVLKDYDLYAFQVNENDFDEGEEIGFLKGVATISGTPTVVFIKNGEEENTSNRLVGDASRSATIKKLKANGYIK